MYFTNFNEKYLPAAAQLEKSSYPQEIAQGLEGFEEEMKEFYFRDLSVVGFSKGKIVCYAVAYLKEETDLKEKRCIYVSDINCPNPAYLKRLLLKFFAGIEAQCLEKMPVISAHMRNSSYQLIQGKQKRKNREVTVLDEEWIPGFYPNGEGAYKVRFTVDYKKILKHSWKDEFQLWVDQISDSERESILAYAFQWFYDCDMDRKELYEEKNKHFILNCIKESVVDYYAMFPRRISIEVSKRLLMRDIDQNGQERYEKTIKTYESYGYMKEQGDKQYSYFKFQNCLNIYSKSEVYYTRYPEQLSGIRWFWKQQIRFWKNKNADVAYFNRYGVFHDLVNVPYLTERYYLYLVDKLCFIQKMEQELGESCSKDELERFRIMCNRVYYLLSGKEARECIRAIVSHRKPNNPNYFHDWELCVSKLTEAKHILTAGAVKHMLVKSYNQALVLSRCVGSLLELIELAKRMRTPFDIKALRKEFSSTIRKDKDCVGYVNRLHYKKESKYRSQLKLPASQEKNILEFVERMRRYNPVITFYNIFQEFGAQVLKKFISGTYPCIFDTQEISIPYPQLGDYVENVLKQRTRSAKRLYQDLLKKGLLFVVLSHEMTREQCGEVLEILRFHNLLKKNSSMGEKYNFKIIVEPKGSPEFLTAGDASVCCMSFGSQKAKVYAKEKGFGILNVYYKDRVIANSVIWINEPYKCLVLDNIEVHPNYTKHNEILKECFSIAAGKLTGQYGLKFAVQGGQFNDLVLYRADSREIKFAAMKPAEVKTKYFYTDAEISRVIFQKMPEQELETMIESVCEEIDIQAA